MHIARITAAKALLFFIVGASVALPLVAAASTGAWTAPSLWPTGYWGQGGLVSCTGNYLNGANQCTNLCDLIDTVINVIYFVMTIAIFVITPISFLAGAIMVMMSGANPEMLSKGKHVITGTVIGLGIVLCSYLIVFTAIQVLGISGVGGFGTSLCSVSS